MLGLKARIARLAHFSSFLLAGGFALVVTAVLLTTTTLQAWIAFSGVLVLFTTVPAVALALCWQKKLVHLRRAYGAYYPRATLDATVWSFSLGSVFWLLVRKSERFGSVDDLAGQTLGAAIVSPFVSIMCVARWVNAMAEESEQPPVFAAALTRANDIGDSLAVLVIFAATLILAAEAPVAALLPAGLAFGAVVAAEFLAVYIFTVMSLPLNEEEMGRRLG